MSSDSILVVTVY